MSRELVLSPKPFSNYTATEFSEYVRTLYAAPPKKEPPAELLIKRAASGKLSILNRRKPAWITRDEISTAAKTQSLSQAECWNYCAKRKFLIVAADADGRKLSADLAAVDSVWPKVRVRK